MSRYISLSKNDSSATSSNLNSKYLRVLRNIKIDITKLDSLNQKVQ